MSITDVSDISANLLAAQDNQSRKPLVSLISAPKLNDIPFDGQFLTHATYDIIKPNCLTHSTGKLVVVGNWNQSSNGYVRFIVTDINRIEFVQSDSYMTSKGQLAIAICEKTDADIGAIIKYDYESLSRHYFYYGTFDIDGSWTGGANIFYVGHAFELTDPWVQTVGTDDYLLVYSYHAVATCSAVGDQLTFVDGGASNDTIENLSATFVADGFVAGQTITVSSTDFNDGTYILDTVATDLLTLTSAGVLNAEAGQVGDTISRNDYFIYKRTSTGDFSSWTAESALSIAGLVSTARIRNLSMIEIVGGSDDGDQWLWFDVLESISDDGEELTNIYYSVSSDSGATWGTAVQVTTNTLFSDTVKHPVAIQRVADTMDVVYTRNLSINNLRAGDGFWLVGNDSFSCHIDTATRMLYVVNCEHIFKSVVKINIDTWQVVDYWDASTSVPQFPAGLDADPGPKYQRLSEGPHVVVYTNEYYGGTAPTRTGGMHVFHLDDSGATTITRYSFNEDVTNGWAQNIDAPAPAGFESKYKIVYAQFVDGVTPKIYLLMMGKDNGGELLGYINTSTGAWIEIASGDLLDFWVVNSMVSPTDKGCGMYVNYDNDYIVCAGGWGSPDYGACKVFDISSGAEIRTWYGGDHKDIYGNDDFDPNFPKHGLKDPFAYGYKIYAGVHSYSTEAGFEHQVGLVELDVLTGVIIYHRPTFTSENDLTFAKPSFMELDPITGNPKLLMAIDYYGVAIFDTVSTAWEIFNDSNVPGFPDLDLKYHQCAYDATSGLIVFGAGGRWEVAAGAWIMSKDGYMETPWFIEGAYGTPWTFDDGNPEQFVQQLNGNTNAVVCNEPGETSLYAFWQNEDSANLKQLMWDKDGSELDISQYIVNTTDVLTSHSIDGSPSTLDFTLSNGHLFDPNNISSLLSTTLQKGRKIELRWGETISGSPDWSNGGDFYVVSTTLGFVKGKYPTLTAHCEDQRTIWQHSHVFATDNYTVMPDVVLKDLLENWASIDNTLTDFPTFVNEELIYHQWIESDLETIINQICSRFGYFFRFDIDGKATARQISNALAVDHTYADNTKLITYTPDDRYSDFTNRITVMGVERSPTEVLFPEERIGLYSGTLGWWGCEKEIIVWFSEDRSRRCLYPRLQKLDSAEVNMFFKLQGGVTEKLTATGPTTDPDVRYKYCTLEVTAPSLVSALAAAIVAYAAASAIPDWVITDPISGEGFTVPVGRIVEKVAIVIALLILGSEANWQAEIHARPLGEINRKVLATWDDEAHQTKIANVITRTFEDPLCYSGADCQVVADFEGMVVQMQRKRIIITKIAHLQDEEGDTIRVFHPYGEQAIDMFITDINRKYKKGTESTPGYFEDEITGWVVA